MGWGGPFKLFLSHNSLLFGLILSKGTPNKDAKMEMPGRSESSSGIWRRLGNVYGRCLCRWIGYEARTPALQKTRKALACLGLGFSLSLALGVTVRNHTLVLGKNSMPFKLPVSSCPDSSVTRRG